MSKRPAKRKAPTRRVRSKGLLGIHYQVMRDGWIPDRIFSEKEYKERDKYIEYCRRNYQESYSYRVIQDVQTVLRGHCRALGF